MTTSTEEPCPRGRMFSTCSLKTGRFEGWRAEGLEDRDGIHTGKTCLRTFCAVECSIRTTSSNKRVLSGGEAVAVREADISYATT
jgi:hypothetical protein